MYPLWTATPTTKDIKMELKEMDITVKKTHSLNYLLKQISCGAFKHQVYKFLWEHKLELDPKKKIPVTLLKKYLNDMPSAWIEWLGHEQWITAKIKRSNFVNHKDVLQVKFITKQVNRNQEDYIVVLTDKSEWIDIVSLTCGYIKTNDLSDVNYNFDWVSAVNQPTNGIYKHGLEESFDFKIIKNCGSLTKWLKKIK